MRPIKLKIKGLNSFIEEQTIDFEKLTDRGLFGIFGPTGSGKSTILDGITLALYGDISRKSSNYINTNCDRLNVSFEFQISGAEIKRYLVTREFKRDKKSGNPISGKCKIVDITNGEEVLADKVKAVTDKCKEVIGLSLEDFTRTVVLPQGKFSEFLKLEGKPRREMLERLFNLEQYGDNLSRKLSREINHEKTENSVLLGQLMGYEDISEEKKAEKEEELKLSIDNLNKVAKELKDIDKSFKENQELWDMQLEVRGYKEKENALKERAIEIESFKEKVKLGEAANKVKPYISTYENTLNNINFTERELRELKIKCEELNSNKKIIEEQWNNARLIRDSKLSQYKVQEEKIKDAINDKKSLDLLENEIKEINNNVNELNKKKKENEEKLVDSEDRLKRENDLLKEKEEYRDTLNIDSEFKKYVQDGLVLTRDYNNYLKLLKDIETKINTINELVKKSLEEKNILKVESDKKNYLLKENENNLESLIKNCPGNQNDLFDMQEKYSELKGKLDIFKRSNEELLKNKDAIEVLSKDLEPKKEEYINLENEIKKIKIEILEIERENLAHKLREELNEGDICPVCGSVEHHKEKIKHVDIKDDTNLEKSIDLKEKLSIIVLNSIRDIEAKLSIAKEKIKESESIISDLGEDFNEEVVLNLQVKMNELKSKINDYNIKKKALKIE